MYHGEVYTLFSMHPIFSTFCFICALVYISFECGLHDIRHAFYKIKSCYRSNLSIISSVNVRSIDECTDFANERRGLAINYSPPGKNTKKYRNYYFVNCQVLGCPEMVNSSTLIADDSYDYYSIYGDLTGQYDVSKSLVTFF